MRSVFLVAVLMLLPAAVRAGGSVDFARMDRLLQQKPDIRAVLVQSLVMPDSAFAQIRLGPHFQHLGGERLGPYTFEAWPRSGTGLPVLVTLCTSYRLLDAAGEPIPEGTDQALAATEVRELLDAVVIRDAGASSAADCPGDDGP